MKETLLSTGKWLVVGVLLLLIGILVAVGLGRKRGTGTYRVRMALWQAVLLIAGGTALFSLTVGQQGCKEKDPLRHIIENRPMCYEPVIPEERRETGKEKMPSRMPDIVVTVDLKTGEAIENDEASDTNPAQITNDGPGKDIKGLRRNKLPDTEDGDAPWPQGVGVHGDRRRARRHVEGGGGPTTQRTGMQRRPNAATCFAAGPKADPVDNPDARSGAMFDHGTARGGDVTPAAGLDARAAIPQDAAPAAAGALNVDVRNASGAQVPHAPEVMCYKTWSPELVMDGSPELHKYLRSRQTAFTKCYLQQARKNPNIGGRLVLKIQVDPAGKAVASVVKNRTGDPDLATCVVEKIGKWKLPVREKPYSERVTINFRPM